MPRGRPKKMALEGGEVKPIEINNIVNVAPVEDTTGNSVADMNDIALRIWEGQSVSLGLIHRVTRIISRLKAKGYTSEDIKSLKLPAKGFEKYL